MTVTRKIIRRISRCIHCGKTPAEKNHAGGQNHIAWFTMPFCVPHHDQFHELLRVAGVNLEWTDDPVERHLRALDALRIAEHMITQELHDLNSRGDK